MDVDRSNTSMGEGVLAALGAVVLAVALWVGAGFLGAQMREQGAVSLRATVLETAMQCFAIEGAYPPSLAYLEDHYGLSINREIYIVTYETYASNVAPSVVVKVR